VTTGDHGNLPRREDTPPNDGAIPQRAPGVFERLLDRVADVPWGLLVLIVLVVLALFDQVHADDIRAFATAAGLLGVGHGIHTGAKNLAKRQDK
jgi:hypothetical protein